MRFVAYQGIDGSTPLMTSSANTTAVITDHQSIEKPSHTALMRCTVLG